MFSKKITFTMLSFVAMSGIAQTAYSMQASLQAAAPYAKKACAGLGGAMIAYDIANLASISFNMATASATKEENEKRNTQNTLFKTGSYLGGAYAVGGKVGLAAASTLPLINLAAIITIVAPKLKKEREHLKLNQEIIKIIEKAKQNEKQSTENEPKTDPSDKK